MVSIAERLLTAGLELAKLASLPDDVMAVAKAVSGKLTELEENSKSTALIVQRQVATRDSLPHRPREGRLSLR